MWYQSKIKVDGIIIDNPKTKAQFTKNKILEFIKNTYIANEKRKAGLAAQQAIINTGQLASQTSDLVTIL